MEPLWICHLEPTPGTGREGNCPALKLDEAGRDPSDPSSVPSHNSQVVLAADMLGLDGLKDVVEMVLTRDYCRFFPKVYTGICPSIRDANY